MKRRPSLWITTAWCALVPLAGLSVWAAEQQRKPEPGPAAAADQAGPDADLSPAELTKAFERLEIQSALAYVKLTELDLQKITQMNEKMSGVYSNSEVDLLRSAVEIAKERVRVAQEVLNGKQESSLVGIAAVRLKSTSKFTIGRSMPTSGWPAPMARSTWSGSRSRSIRPGSIWTRPRSSPR